LKKQINLAGGKKNAKSKHTTRRTKTKSNNAGVKGKLETSVPTGGRKTPPRTKKEQIIDVEAILLSGGKKSVTNRTMDAMTPEEKKEMMGTAGKSLLLQAKKGICVQAMTVSIYF
jgi:hypothetical protein